MAPSLTQGRTLWRQTTSTSLCRQKTLFRQTTLAPTLKYSDARALDNDDDDDADDADAADAADDAADAAADDDQSK